MVLGGLGEVLDDLGAILQRTWSGRGVILGRLGRKLAVLGGSWGDLGSSWAVLGRSWGDLGSSWAVSGRSGGALGLSWAALGGQNVWIYIGKRGKIERTTFSVKIGVQERSWSFLGRSWSVLGAILVSPAPSAGLGGFWGKLTFTPIAQLKILSFARVLQ